MITKEQALTAQNFHHDPLGLGGQCKIKIRNYRRNGRTQTWKTRPDEFRIPVVYGLRGYDQIYHYDADTFHTAEDCPLTK